MAKMFYTLEEASTKLGMSEEEVQNLAESGQLQEFRDRDRLMFKVDQVDLLAGDDDTEEEIGLADSGPGIEPISLSSSATGTGPGLDMSGTNEGTGISIFDAEEGAADANEETLVTSGLGGSGFAMDAGGSGSGLAQMAFEPDDTSLGSNLLDSLGEDDSMAGGSVAGGTAAGGTAAGVLFETTSGEPDFGAAAAAPAALGAMPMGEAYDGPASGLFGGVALAMFALILTALGVMILGMSGGSSSILSQVNQTVIWGVLGGGFVIMLIFGGIGWAALRKS
ncbi:MAG: helix-turn-helix domain-containing protein [Planctomycetota bacterium]